MAISQFPSKGGIPSGNTASRPGSPVIGDTYYNGQLELLEIYNGTAWVAASSPALIPTITVADVGTGVAYGSAQGLVTFTENDNGSVPLGFTVSSSTGGYTATTTSSTATITVGNSGSYTFSGTAYNNFGTSGASPSVTQTLTTIPQAPTIGTATQVEGTSNVTVTWTLGGNGGKNLSSITVTPYLNGVTAQTPQSAATTSSTSLTVTGLSYDSAYTFKVKTTNANGNSLESSATNSVTPINQIQIDTIHIVSGGGSGGRYSGASTVGAGAGGAGGTKTFSSVYFRVGTTYTVTVGAGGAATTTEDTVQGNDGTSSSITGTGLAVTLSTTGGGGGGGNGQTGRNGGSGGGGARAAGGTGISGEGNSGGGDSGSQYAGSGGGGANGAGATGSGETGGNGGSGVTLESYALGGGGAGGGRSVRGTASSGGGNGGYDLGQPSAGTANTGGGGGGAFQSYGAAGGSGVVMVKYSDSLAALTSTTGSPSITVSGGYRLYRWTGSGSFTV